MNEPVTTDEGFIQKEGIDAEMINVQQGNENLEISINKVIEDAQVTLSIVPKKTEVPVTRSSHSSDFTSKFLNFSDIPHTDAEYFSPMDVLSSHNHYNPSLLHHHNQHQHHHQQLKQQILHLNFQISHPSSNSTTESQHWKKKLLNSKRMILSTLKITEQVKSQLPQILPKEVSNFAPLIIKSMVTESLEHAVLAKESSQPKSTYEAASLLTKFKLKKILINKMDENKVKDEDPSTGSDRALKKKTSKDTESTKEELEFEVADSNMPQDQEENLGNDDEEPKRKVVTKRDWFTKPKQPEDPTDPDWNVGKTLQQGPTQSWLMTLASLAEKPLKTFDELMSTPIDFSAYIMNGLKITNLTQETLLGPAFKLLKGTHTNYAELEYDFEECYKALSEKLDWDNPKGGDYPFDLTKPLPLVMNGNRQMHYECSPEAWKKDSYTPYQDPQGFIYVDTQGRNMLMRSDELYKFSDGTLTRLRTLLDDITKNI
ncbi:hypothetical protein Tco_0924049 [Tanacetum coccineum]|uniref:Uncharacterized protein n=1 Tax=Tanacetum coccineum TaxID=301880 RepID=A0ABQ5D2U3_9ASTR